METFVWDQYLTTGLTHVDEQHKVLVDTFNGLSEALQRSNTGDSKGLAEAYERMVDYAQLHFAEEERLMRDKGLAPQHVQTHTARHQQFITQVDAMWRSRGALQDPAETFVGFLTSWLGLHILGVDQSLARQIASLARGETAEQAYVQEMQVHDQGTQALIRMVGRLYHVLSLQNTELAQANLLLEERVEQRTRELAKANAHLEAFARIDGLLQIANRSYFDDRLEHACVSAFRREQPLGLLMIDVDYFKHYNDRYGHQAGDVCLQAVARAVSQVAPRATDLVARYGGEELAVVLPDTDTAGTSAVAERVVNAVATLRLQHEASTVAPYVTVSVGAVSHVPPPQGAAAQHVAKADAALYRAKEAGRNRWLMA